MKKQQRWQLLTLGVVVALVLAGCVGYDAAGNPTGWVYEYFGKPAAAFLDLLAGLFGGSYGIAIIIVTLLTRIFMLPSSLKMTKDSMISQARMKIAQPEIDAVREAMDAAVDPTEKAQLQQELMAVYKKYDINMLGGVSGCLPLLIQMPIISAVYAAIRTSPAIQENSFLGIHLGSKSFIIVVLVIIFTFVQSWMMQAQMPQSDNAAANQTSKTMLWLNPIMLGYFTYISAAGLGIYFLTGSVFMLGQQLYTNQVVRPKIQEIIDQETEKAKTTAKASPRKDVTPVKEKKQRLVPTKEAVQAPVVKRNAGKQNRKK